MMPALSFKREWIDALLSGDKRQTTRKPTPPGKPPRVKEGDVCQIYVEQRMRISAKLLRQTTVAGREQILKKIEDGKYPRLPEMDDCGKYPKPQVMDEPERAIRYSDLGLYYAHFLGTVEVSGVYTVCPAEMCGDDLDAWAWCDGFPGFDEGDMWFVRHYGEGWLDQVWTAIRWNGWKERYFKAML
jgi:hypothetical protein